MRRRLRWFGSLAAAAMLAGMVAGPQAMARAQSGEECWEWRRVIKGEDENGNPTYGYELVNICESGGGGGSGGGGPNTCEHPEYGEFPCYDPGRGWWSSAWNCYVKLTNPQPPLSDDAWGGHAPEEGAVYTVSCPEAAGTFTTNDVFLDEAPDVPSVSELAQRAVDDLPLVGADIGIAPGPDGAGLVGLPVWMWTNNADATWGPVRTSVSGPGITVVAEGTATQIEWSMGDGTTVVCEGPGTPYEARYGDQHSPDCGHVYTEPSRALTDGRYTVTATTSWQVEWWVEPQGSAAEGDDFFSRTSTTTVRINELQVVTS